MQSSSCQTSQQAAYPRAVRVPRVTAGRLSDEDRCRGATTAGRVARLARLLAWLGGWLRFHGQHRDDAIENLVRDLGLGAGRDILGAGLVDDRDVVGVD